MTATAVEVITDVDQLSRLAPAWTELADAAGGRPFTRPSWCTPWWSTLGRGELAVITVRNRSGLVALAPFHRRRRPALNSVRFLGHGLGSVTSVLVAPGHGDAARRLWEVALRGRRVVELVEYDERGGGLDELSQGPWAVRIEDRDVCPTVGLEGSFDGFMAARKADLRRVLRRSERKLAERGVPFAAEVATSAGDVQRLLPEVVRVTDRAEAAHPRQHLLAGRWAGFGQAMLASMAADGRLRLFVGRVGANPAGFALTVNDADGMAMWFNRHDPAFGDVSPGHLLIREMVRYGFDHGIGEVDLLIGDFRYKRLWATGDYRTLTVTAAGHDVGLLVADRQDRLIERLRGAPAAVRARLRRGEEPDAD